MPKKKKKIYSVLLEGSKPGLYEGRVGKGARTYSSLEAALNALRQFLAEGRLIKIAKDGKRVAIQDPEELHLLPGSLWNLKRAPIKPPAEDVDYFAYCDGSLKDGQGSASVVLVGERGALSVGQLAYPKAQSSLEAEVRGFLLALLMAPRGAKLRVETDLETLAKAAKGEFQDPFWGKVFQVAYDLAALWELEVEVKKVPRKKVQEAHDRASLVREEMREYRGRLGKTYAFLQTFPPRYRLAALELLEKYPGEASKLQEWLAQGKSPTRSLLLERLAGMERKEVADLLAGVRNLPQSVREALKGRDRKAAWEDKPPTEKQLALLKRLGYKGPPPASVEEASDLISSLVTTLRSKA